jgi:phosphatidylglycerophosphatase A
MKQLSRLIGTAFYTGYAPVAPGTAGSFFALLLFILIPGLRGWPLFGICFFIFFVGVWAGTIIENSEGKDPSIVVVDEVVGMWISLLFLPFPMHWVVWVVAFLVFRLLDIVKPFPAGWSQSLSGGWGIMLDDVIAGIYTNILIRVTFVLFGY